MKQPAEKSKISRLAAVTGVLLILGLLLAYYMGDQGSSVGVSGTFTIDTQDPDAECKGISLLVAADSGSFSIDTRDPDNVVIPFTLAMGEDSAYFTIDTRDPDTVAFVFSQVSSEWSGYFTIDTMAAGYTRAESAYFTIDTLDADSVVRRLALLAGEVSSWFTINTLDPPPEDADGDTLHDLWEVLHFGSVLARGPRDDPDGDGRSNFEEFAFGTDPGVFDGPTQIELSVETGPAGGRLILKHSKHILAFGMVDYRYEISTDLKTWVDNTASWQLVALPENLNGYVEWVTFSYDQATLPTTVFVRVGVRPKG